MEKILDLGDEYRLRAVRERVGNFVVVSIGWVHPNRCFDFSGAMIWVRSMHLNNWKLVPGVNWSKNYEGVKDFLCEGLQLKNCGLVSYLGREILHKPALSNSS
ncbi:hypothetical protein AKJ43_02695 [candidate division MSBL1 archaeon SCGC-AAA261D19]|uniref:Uncharacterized protein n=1 Tax=candidate division MSBL1 archaeon SCGC-AAA261D19 TaxID=1698273 RepID=A0A133V6E3_9EURY|nr:hypothetical protein AKJ43_02695 [candidate division MSBL1 archaeon SCGC-AAA261D19]